MTELHTSARAGLALAVLAAALSLASRARAADKEACATAAEEAQNFRDASRLLDARARLVTCADPACPAQVRSDCTGWLAQVDAELPSIAVRAHDAEGHDVLDASVLVDGARVSTRLDGKPIALDPGEHVVRVEPRGAPAADERVLVVAGERNRPVVITLRAPAAAEDTRAARPAPDGARAGGAARVAGIGLLALGAVGVGAFTVLEILGQGEYKSMSDGCATSHACAPGEVDAARAKFVGAGVALGVGVAAAAAGALLVLTAPKGAPPASVRIGAGRVDAAIRF